MVRALSSLRPRRLTSPDAMAGPRFRPGPGLPLREANRFETSDPARLWSAPAYWRL